MILPLKPDLSGALPTRHRSITGGLRYRSAARQMGGPQLSGLSVQLGISGCFFWLSESEHIARS